MQRSERTNDERASVIAGAAAASFGSREDADEYVYAVALRMIDEAVDAEIARLARELEEAREAASDARKEAVRLAVEQRDAAAENIRLAAELAEMRRLYADMTLERGRLRGALEEARERERALRDDLTAAIGHLSALVDLLHHDGYPEHSDRAALLVSAAETYLESPSLEQEVGAATAEIADRILALRSGSGSPPGEGERASCRCAPAAPWRSDGATCPDWPGCGNPDWRPATPQEASGAD